ncbi:thiamine biosynthesis protein MoeB [Cytobacillus firmus]|uniref:MoeB/ThiF family adenylyltransferase n=1 Tax=Cytobacillus firmus TaxID=1399 RepID=UPI00077CBF7A|nr:MoeB/ThiF family adenylyltransferase [Cytobacillus firmus]MBG9543765.1 thiamine biosynthesis protein MoeB [Cytobacillus firmus]MBG9553102.1 thiamine biosynthesis protein MoeB [Cytobacillus firmus]MBG9555899.1 thiamine biosynthesis protein MoeB [Cytobacillus firmus]MBG9574893.1 thiamine biosynthesis protein MoeB [Cytobacillus firmus]MEC1891919.1 MoeB/ThiF family adenylyltransferase [Cytobacillus firmus]
MSERYSRQMLFPPIGKEGQKKLREKHALIIGAGALGAANAETLTRAGVGKLTIADRDYVEWSNLQRQQLYCEEDAVRKVPKAIAAAKRLKAINSEVQIFPRIMDVGVQEMEELIEDVDLIIDSTDNFDIRFLINDISQKHRIPWIYGGCVGSYGLSYTILPGVTPCLNCLMDKLPLGGATCDTAGVIQPAIQMVAAHQSAEALKILAENLESLRATLISFDVWKNQFSSVNVSSLRNPQCLSCGTKPIYPFLDYRIQTKTSLLCGRDTVQIRPSALQDMDVAYLEKSLVSQGINVESNPYLLSFSINDARVVVFKDGRVLVHGVRDILQAKNLYHRFLG